MSLRDVVFDSYLLCCVVNPCLCLIRCDFCFGFFGVLVVCSVLVCLDVLCDFLVKCPMS